MEKNRISKSYSQFREDELLNEYFGGKLNGFYLELGAFNGVEMSNTLYFEDLGWRGLLVEADPELAAECRLNRPRAIVENCALVSPGTGEAVTFEVVPKNRGLSSLALSQVDLDRVKSFTGTTEVRRITVAARTVDDLLIANGLEERIDFVTVDVEGHEWAVLQGFNLARWKPEVVIVERNRMLPDRRIMRYFHANGYRYWKTTGVNDWFRNVPGRAPTMSYYVWLASRFYFPKLVVGVRNRTVRFVNRLVNPQVRSGKAVVPE